MAGSSKISENSELLVLLEQVPEGLLILDEQGVILFANTPGARLVKLRPKKAVGSVFEHAVEDGPMRDFDVEMTVKSVQWEERPARLLHLKSLKSSGAFHLEWKLEAALERARTAEEALAEQKLLNEQSCRNDVQTEVQDFAAEVSRLQSALEETEQRVRAAEEQADIAEERAYELELELEERGRADEANAGEGAPSGSTSELEETLEKQRVEIEELTSELNQAREERSTALEESDELAEQLRIETEHFELRIDELDTALVESQAEIASLKGELERSGGSAEPAEPVFQDELTGLPNRHILRSYLGFMLSQSTRHNRLTALLRIDCGALAEASDRFGPEAAGQLTREVGERLSSVVRSNDVLGRYGEHEFVIFLPELKDQDDATAMIATLLRRLDKKMRRPFKVSDESIDIDASVGISLYPIDAHNGEQMFDHAAVAQKQAIESKEHRYYSDEIQNHRNAQATLDEQLRVGLDEEQFELLYQPIFDLAKNEVIGLESLIRWNHPDHGVVEPDYFLQVAEDSGMIVLIGNWALREAFKRAAMWQRGGLGAFVSINLSKKQLLQADLVPIIESSLAEFGCSADWVLLEVAEKLTSLETTRVRETLFELNRIGIRLAIDNFGTGATSFQELKRGPFQVLKIERQFVSELFSNDENVGIVMAALTAGHHLGRITIAVGVEGEKERAWLTQSGARFAQGNFLSPPLTADEIDPLVNKG